MSCIPKQTATPSIHVCDSPALAPPSPLFPTISQTPPPLPFGMHLLTYCCHYLLKDVINKNSYSSLMQVHTCKLVVFFVTLCSYPCVQAALCAHSSTHTQSLQYHSCEPHHIRSDSVPVTSTTPLLCKTKMYIVQESSIIIYIPCPK